MKKCFHERVQEMKAIYITAFCVAMLGMHSAGAQEWWFWPKYTLGQHAENYPGSRMEYPQTPFAAYTSERTPIVFHGEEPTERITNFLSSTKLPTKRFSAELWLVNHVNQPVGVLVTVKKKFTGDEPVWLLGAYAKNFIFSVKSEGMSFSKLLSYEIKNRGWKNYWLHVTAVFDGLKMQLYLNGELVGEQTASELENFKPEDVEIEVAAYMTHEPYMDLGNMMKMFHLYEDALSQKYIQGRFEYLKTLVTEGKLFPDLFHFNAGPYLNNATTSSVDIVWETDRPADFVVEYGKKAPLTSKVELVTQKLQPERGQSSESNIYKITLNNLEAETPYFYNIKAMARDGKIMESGMLTFSTAVKETSSFAFGVIGDTEARPHINDRLSKLLWDERPNFIVNVGDLTDGGVKDHKFEWNYEYFQGVNQLASRIPVFPVPGNGEDDLYWYNQYHTYSERGYYNFRYGNAEFFMLNSNAAEDFASGGKQYAWLEEQLKKSTATWKFVAHHHAPYSADEDDYGDSWSGPGQLGDLRIRKIVPLYEKYGVDMVFFGHLHTYQRTMPIKAGSVDTHNGVIYIQGGGGGGNLEDFAPSRAWFSAKTYRGHHYFTITVHDKNLSFKMYDTEGRLKDFLDINK